MPPVKRIAINTGGGDAPGLNAVIRAATLSAHELGWEVVGIRHGYEGLLNTDQTEILTRDRVWDIAHWGGTILGTSNKGHPFEYPVQQPDGTIKPVDRSAEIVANFRKLKLDALIAIGGDGSLRIAKRLGELGIPIIGVPKTIDNDLESTVVTFGFDTAVSNATWAIDKLHSTAEAHRRVMVVEVMGRYAGWIALHSGIASTADVILIPEIPYDIEKVCAKIKERQYQGYEHAIVVVAEGAKAKGGDLVTVGAKEIGREVRLGGVSGLVAEDIGIRMGKETRTIVLGHILRGGEPTTFDRVLGLRFGTAAVRAIQAGKFGHMVALNPPTVNLVPITEAVARMKSVPLDCDTVHTARSLGIGLGD